MTVPSVEDYILQRVNKTSPSGGYENGRDIIDMTSYFHRRATKEALFKKDGCVVSSAGNKTEVPSRDEFLGDKVLSATLDDSVRLYRNPA
jgi:hypothetical protein